MHRSSPAALKRTCSYEGAEYVGNGKKFRCNGVELEIITLRYLVRKWQFASRAVNVKDRNMGGHQYTGNVDTMKY